MTARRALPLAAVAAALAVGGCSSGTAAKLTPAQEQARLAFVKAHGNYSDRELAQLCPGLYPKHFLTDTGKYPIPRGEKTRKHPTPTARDRAEAQAAGCDVRP
jgi:hypothetical protein